MEGTHLSSSSDPENNFDTTKSKKKKRLFEFEPRQNSDDTVDASRRRALAREALLFEQSKEPPRGISGALAAQKLVERPSETILKPETEETKESEEADKGMTSEERQYAAQVLRRESRRERHEFPPDPDAPPVIEAGDLLVDEWDDRIENGQDIDEAFAAILEEHDIDQSIISEQLEGTEASADEPIEKEAVIDTSSHEFPLYLGDEEVVINTHTREKEAREKLETENPDIVASLHAKYANTNEAEPALGNDNFRTERSSTNRVTPEKNHAKSSERSKSASPALLSGITGYFVGRRRGSSTTEKKLLPVQKKLEAQVNELSWELKEKEAKIRQVAAEYVKRKGPAIIETIAAVADKVKQKKTEYFNETGINPIVLHDRATLERGRAPEAKLLHGGKESPEHIGHVLINGEAGQRSKELPSKTLAQEKIELPPDKRIDTLSRPELLSISGKIVVEGTSLRQIYETHLIGEYALRRLVAEHLHGGDIRKSLQREILEHEIDFERDPALRDIAIPNSDIHSSAAQVIAPGKEALNQLLQKAAEEMPETEDDLSFIKPPTQSKDNQDSQQPTHRRPVDLVMAITILVLFVFVITLYLWRR